MNDVQLCVKLSIYHKPIIEWKKPKTIQFYHAKLLNRQNKCILFEILPMAKLIMVKQDLGKFKRNEFGITLVVLFLPRVF